MGRSKDIVSKIRGLSKRRVRDSKRREKQSSRYRPRFEQLESRRLLAVATDLANISGIVYDDIDGNGLSAGEEIAGATVNVYRDNGNGIFEPGAGDGSPVATDISDATGRYTLTGLTAGSYFVQQPAQTIGGNTLSQQVSQAIPITAAQAEGILIRTIDSFDETTDLVSDTTNDGVRVASSLADAATLGGERDIFVNKTSVNGLVRISINDPLQPGILAFDSFSSGDGQWNVSWDGIDGDALTLNDAGLGGVDLTSGGTAAGFRLQIGADNLGGTAIVRVYSDDGNGATTNRSSQTTLVIPDTGGSATSTEYIPFSAFIGTADFTQVGAIELDITGVPNINGTAELVGAIGPTTITQDFDNFEQADLSLTKVSNTAAPVVGQTVSFTVSVTNSGPNSATNVEVLDQLPTGITFGSATPSQGTYNNATGIWTVGSLLNGATATLQINGTLATAGDKTNTAEIIRADQTDPDSTPGNGLPGEDDQASVTIAPQLIDLSLLKSVNNASPNVGEEVTFTLTINNAGPSTATGVAVTDVLPGGLTFVSASPSQGNFSSTGGLWTVGDLVSGGTATLNLTARVISAGTKTNSAQVTAAGQADVDSTPNNNDPTEDDQASVAVTPQVADLSLTKVADSTSPNVSQNVVYTITLNNAGPSAATGVQVVDLLPSGIAFVSAQPSIGSYDSNSGLWTVGSIGSNNNQTLILTGRIDSVGAKTNVAEVTASDQFDSDSTPGNGATTEDDRAEVTVTPQTADLSLAKTVNDASPNVGENVTFTLTVSNSGPNQATGVRVLDELPTGMTFVSSSGSQGVYDSGTGVWNVGTISNSGTATLRIVATAGNAGLNANSAEIIASDQLDPDSTPGNGVPGEDDTAEVTFNAEIVDLSLAKTVNTAQPNLGENVTFTITVNNAGPDAATNVVVVDRLPTGLTFVSATPSQGTFNTTTRQWSIPTVPAFGSVTMTLVARVNAATTLTNTVEILDADQPDIDSTPGNNVASEDDQAVASITTRQADLSLTKTVDNANPNVGDNVTFTIDLNNDGPDAATGVQVLDTLPTGMTFVSASATLGTFDSTSRTWSVGTVPNNSGAQLEIIARVDTRGIKTNTAQVSASEVADPDSTPGNNLTAEDDQASVSLTPQLVDLALTKGVDVAQPNVGANVVYNLAITNTGTDTATGVAVTDTLPVGVTFISAIASLGNYDDATGVWNVGSVARGSTPTLAITVRVDTPNTKTNVAEITATDQLDVDSTPDNGITTEDDYASIDITPLSADLSLTKTVDDPTPNVGENVTFTITVTNSGPDGATGIQVEDQLPPDVVFVSATASRGSYNELTGIWDLGALGNQGTATLQIVANGTNVIEKVNQAEIVASDTRDPDSTPGNNDPTEDDQATVAIEPQLIDLSLTKTIDNNAPNRGENVVYTLVVTNDGPSDATGIEITDRLPEGMTFVSAAVAQGAFNASTGVWTAGSLVQGASATLRLTATVNTTGTVLNTAEITAADQPDSDSTPGNNNINEDDFGSAIFVTPVADLGLTKIVADSTPLASEDVIFTITVVNNGPDDATGVVVRDLLPPGLLFQSSTETQGTYDSNTGLWNVGGIPNTGTATMTLRARINSADPSTNTAEIVAVAQFDPDSTPDNGIAGEDDQASVTVTPEVSDLSVTAAVDNPTPELGDSVVTTFTVSNAGPDTATDVILSLPIPAGFTFVRADVSQGTFDAASGLWTLGTLLVGETRTIRITERVDAFGIRPHNIEVQSVDQFDPDSTPGNLSLVEDDYASVMIQAPRNLSKRLFLSR
ncbi:Large cysteine-rich periplasmic protein omcB precursor [Rosistilla carotiformis]|uniref:Large cysteine-rich periplasmic protein omcB n=1 Tax=Rosistilla carotiformis TaxID=2528017 RepID=A0A518JV99_9BACT|nr:DUF11 domain-containing protein [Rosistilla carotiformis]QDV69471.1 Large cysteine-rich periplasmic protein omcB precursor [Rosistilla carotiformis]